MLQSKRWVTRVREFGTTLDPAWRFALSAYLVVRIAFSVWSLIIFLLFPTVLQNPDLFGAPVLAVFGLATSERFTYSRQIDGTTLAFRVGEPGYVVETQTGSKWSLRDGRAVSGKYVGRTLGASPYSAEDVFPYHRAAVETNPLLALWQRFDTNWYLAIAERGYAGNDGSTVYFPLYPALIRIVGAIIGNRMLAALLVSNLALLGALVLLYRLSETLFFSAIAQRAVAYQLIFPTGFFLLTAYTESFFLFLALSVFAFAQQGRWFYASLFGAFAALTRLQGVLLIVPLGYMWWKWIEGTGQKREGKMRVGAALLVIPLATVAFLALTNLSLITAYEGQLHAQFVWPWENVGASVALLTSGRRSLIDGLNLLVTLGFGVMMIAVWRKLPREYALYALAMYLAPLFRMTTTQPLVSMLRYALVVFPVFMLWGVWGRNAWANRAIVYLSFPLQLYLSAQFVMWGWVG